MKRREFLALFGSATAMLSPKAAGAQQPDRVRLIGVLMGFAENDANAHALVAAFRDGLAKLGWTEGSKLRIEIRWGAGDPDKMRTFARELVDLRPDVILGQTTPVLRALARETRTIPIVFAVHHAYPRPRPAPYLAVRTADPQRLTGRRFNFGRNHENPSSSLAGR